MKKKLLSIIAIICMLIPCIFSLASCSLFDEDVQLGTYVASQITYQTPETSITLTREQLEGTSNPPSNVDPEILMDMSSTFIFSAIYTIKENNVITISLFDSSIDGTWAIDYDILTLTFTQNSETESIEATYSNDSFIISETEDGITWSIKYVLEETSNGGNEAGGNGNASATLDAGIYSLSAVSVKLDNTTQTFTKEDFEESGLSSIEIDGIEIYPYFENKFNLNETYTLNNDYTFSRTNNNSSTDMQGTWFRFMSSLTFDFSDNDEEISATISNNNKFEIGETDGTVTIISIYTKN